MEKNCFIIMPISDCEPYPSGHFKRVYEYIIKPAVLQSGFQPIRSDDVLNTNDIAIDVIKKILNSDMAVCDLSSRNPNVFYELGIRQAFNLPVTLIRDSLTERAFDIQGFRDIQYDENLRIDNVEDSISILSETIYNTYQSKGSEINSLVSLLGVHPAKVTSNIEISKDTEIILNTLLTLGTRISEIEKYLPSQKANVANFIWDESGGVWKDVANIEMHELQVGDIVEHPKFGKGRITAKSGKPENPIVDVSFQFIEPKKIMLNYANMKKLVLKD